MDYSTDTSFNDVFLLVILAMIIGSFLITTLIIKLYLPFKEERDYLKMEMSRSFEEKEYLYWKRKLKYLYLRSIPLIGRLFR